MPSPPWRKWLKTPPGRGIQINDNVSQCQKYNSSKVVSISFLLKMLLMKTVVAKTAIWVFLPLGHASLMSNQFWRNLIGRAVQELSPAFYRIPIYTGFWDKNVYLKKYCILLNVCIWLPLTIWPERKMTDVTSVGFFTRYRMLLTTFSILLGLRDT